MKSHPQPHGTAWAVATAQSQRFHCPCGVAVSFFCHAFCSQRNAAHCRPRSCGRQRAAPAHKTKNPARKKLPEAKLHNVVL